MLYNSQNPQFLLNWCNASTSGVDVGNIILLDKNKFFCNDIIQDAPILKLPYDSAIPLLGIYPEETKIEKDTCVPLLTVALSTVARTWRQPRCPLTDEWIRKLWYIYTMEYYSAIKRNAFESILMRWMNLEPIIQSEVSQR